MFSLTVTLLELINTICSRALFNEVYDELKEVMKYYGTGNRSMQITFNFDLVGGSPYSTAGDVQGFIDSWMEAMPNGSVPNWVVSSRNV